MVDALPPPPASRGGASNQDYEHQRRHLISLEATVNTLIDELRSSRNEAQEAIASYEGQEVIIGGLMHHLDTAGQVLKSTIKSKNDSAPSKSFITLVEHALFNPQGKLSGIKAQLKSLQHRFDSDGTIECHGVCFSSKTDMAAWFAKNGLTIGVFCNAVALLHTIQVPVVHQSEATKAMEAQQKVSMTTDLEAMIITSFSTILPSILVGNKKEGTGGTFDWLKSYLKTYYAIWDPASRKSGVSSRIKEGIKVAAKQAKGLLSMTTDNLEAVKVASGLLLDSTTFVTPLCTWIKSAHQDLTADTPYTSEEVWDMQLECLEQIFEELHQAWVAVVDAVHILQGIYLWGMLHAWQIQQRYVSNDFQDDPALTGIFVCQVLLHGQDVSLDDHLSKITDGVKKLEEHDCQVQSNVK